MKPTSQEEYMLYDIDRAKKKRSRVESVGSRDKIPDLKSISEALDTYYFANKLGLYCAYLSLKNILKEDSIPFKLEDLAFVKEIIRRIDVNPPQNPKIKIYNQIRKLLEAIDEDSITVSKYFDQTLELIEANRSQHANEEILEFYSLLSNYCIRKMNTNTPRYRITFLWLNNEMINLNYEDISDNKIMMQSSLFKNMVKVALSVNEPSFFHKIKTRGVSPEPDANSFKDRFEWTEKFIQFYCDKLEKSKQAKFYHQYCSTLLEFSRGNFARAYKTFNNVMRVQGTFINLDMKILHLKILYEVKTRKATILEYDKIEIRKVLKQLLNLYVTYDGRIDNDRNKIFLAKKEKLTFILHDKRYSYCAWLKEKLAHIK